jgi:twitching motility protein PilU
MERDQASKFVNDLLRLMVSRNGSDLFLTADFPPAIKVDGKVTKVSPQPLTGAHTLALTRAVMNDKQAAEFEKTKECNFAISPQGIGRFRVNAFVQQGNVGLVMRTIPQTLPTIDSLNLPQVLKDVAMTKRGLVIFVGATGSGKSTSLAAMVDFRNENSHGHIITIEDPVEFVHPHKNCIVTQREVGIDTDGWEQALKNTLRQAPDVILMDDGARRRLRRDRPPVHGHAARQQRQPGAGPHHQLLPGRAPRPAADGPVAQPQGAGVAAPAAAPGRQGPHRGGRDPAEHAADRRHDLQGRGR